MFLIYGINIIVAWLVCVKFRIEKFGIYMNKYGNSAQKAIYYIDGNRQGSTFLPEYEAAKRKRGRL